MSPLAYAVLVSVLVVVAVVPAAAGPLDDLLFDLQLVPLGGRAPAPFSLEALNGGTVSLAGLKGRPVLLYFWASW